MSGIITSLQTIHEKIRPQIKERLLQFRRNDTREKIQKEFFFCLLTPQCKARICWDNVENLFSNGIMQKGSEKQISENLCGVRFRNNKARYIVESRRKFFNGSDFFIQHLSEEQDAEVLREYVVKNVKGMGYKEASHFLRNIGKGDELAILDRHILRGLVMTGVIDKIPDTLPAEKYMRTEESMRRFTEKIKIPMFHLDFVFWYFFNKEVFK